RDGVGVVGARDQDPAGRVFVGEELHDLAAAADHTQGVAVGYRLAQDRQVGADARDALIPAQGGPKARLHLVEDEDDAVLVAQGPQPLEVTGPRGDDADVLQHGLQDDGRYRVAAKNVLDGVQV